MEEALYNPLVIRCPFCGGVLHFDINKQQYQCDYCGKITPPSAQQAGFRYWKSTHQTRLWQDRSQIKAFSCPACGAQTLSPADHAAADCPFCHNTMIDGSFSNNRLPEVIIPFKITLEEAKEKLKAWTHNNKGLPAAKAIDEGIDRLTGCYLPYEVVRGVYDGSLGVSLQEGTNVDYGFKAFLNNTAVNASNDFDNLFLDGIEPFLFDDAREFQFDYLNQQQAKVPNVSAEELNQRIKEETQFEIYQKLSQQHHNKEMAVSLHDDANESAAALMPVYYLRCDNDIAAAVNGQTGKVSVQTGKVKNLTRWWWVLPLIATAVVTVLVGQWFALDWEATLIAAFISALLIFGIANARHKDQHIKEVLTVPNTKCTHNDTQVQFFARFEDGIAPARLKFITFGRVLKIIFWFLFLMLIPALFSYSITHGNIPFKSLLIRGGLWYLVVILIFTGGFNRILYGFPNYIEVFPEGVQAIRKPRVKKTKFTIERFSGTDEKLSKKERALLILGGLILFFGTVYAMCRF